LGRPIPVLLAIKKKKKKRHRDISDHVSEPYLAQF
jgi:hypothetical protein